MAVGEVLVNDYFVERQKYKVEMCRDEFHMSDVVFLKIVDYIGVRFLVFFSRRLQRKDEKMFLFS